MPSSASHAKVKDQLFYATFRPQVSANLIERTVCLRRAHSYIYFRIPKAANTTVASNLYVNEQGVWDLNSEEINRYKVSFERPSTLTEDEIANLDRFFKFTVVRNPATRILSCYLQKIKGNAKEKIIVTKSMGVAEETPIEFEEFIDWLGSENNICKNYHWARQVDLIPVGVDALDFVGKVESLEQDLGTIIARIFGQERGRNLIDFSPGKTHADEKIGQYYTNGIREKLMRVYGSDFEELRYSFPG